MSDLRNTPQGNYLLARAIERRVGGPSGPDVVILPKGTPVRVGPSAAENPDLVSAWIGPLFTSLDPEDLTAEPQDLEEQDAEEGIPEMTERVRVAYEGLNATLLEEAEFQSFFVAPAPLGPLLVSALDLEDPDRESLISALRDRGFFVQVKTFNDRGQGKEGLSVGLRTSSLACLPEIQLIRDASRHPDQVWEAWSPEFRFGWYGETPRKALLAFTKKWIEGSHAYVLERVARTNDLVLDLKRLA